MTGDLLGHCARCGISLMESSVLNWPGHTSRPPFPHYPVIRSGVSGLEADPAPLRGSASVPAAGPKRGARHPERVVPPRGFGRRRVVQGSR